MLLQFFYTNSMELSPFEKPTVIQLLRHFSTFYATRRKFITVFTKAFY
jgi:hypothetical protein